MTATPSNVLPISADNIGAGRDKNGRFTSGPGNVGRPYGAKSRHQRDFSQLLIAMIPRVALKISEAIDNSERWALELVAKLALPNGLTILMHGSDVDDITAAINDGDITAEQAAALIAVRKAGKAITELDEYRAQLKELLEKYAPR